MIPFIKEYQAGRILAWFYPEQYGEARYQQNNSIIAIGSGQLHGKGLYNTTIASVKNGNFLSEEQTDFIFAVIGEELGFIGCAIVILLFLLIVYECLMMAARAKDMLAGCYVPVWLRSLHFRVLPISQLLQVFFPIPDFRFRLSVLEAVR